MGTLLEDDFTLTLLARSDGGPFHVEVFEVGNLFTLAGAGVIHPDIQAMLSSRIGQVVHLLAVPHGQGIGSLPVGDAFGLFGAQVKQPDVGCHTAAIALPRSVVCGVRSIGKPRAVRAEATVHTVGDRQFLRQTALCRDGIHFHPRSETAQVGSRENQPAVGCPLAQPLEGRVVSHPVGNASIYRHGVDIAVAVVVAH
ncbi:hypothetical protein HRbin16_00176 [bacterium HR16]|nr:hypothetical protein HRbin16_00176 [bacterium HR16]